MLNFLMLDLCVSLFVPLPFELHKQGLAPMHVPLDVRVTDGCSHFFFGSLWWWYDIWNCTGRLGPWMKAVPTKTFWLSSQRVNPRWPVPRHMGYAIEWCFVILSGSNIKHLKSQYYPKTRFYSTIIYIETRKAILSWN